MFTMAGGGGAPGAPGAPPRGRGPRAPMTREVIILIIMVTVTIRVFIMVVMIMIVMIMIVMIIIAKPFIVITTRRLRGFGRRSWLGKHMVSDIIQFGIFDIYIAQSHNVNQC